jgi:hypothetical protein
MKGSPVLLSRLLGVCGLVFISICCDAQVTVMTDSTSLNSYTAVKGDTLLIGYDSAFLSNKIVYKLLQDNYKRVRRNGDTNKALMEDFEKLIALQDSMLKSKESYYQVLKLGFDSLAANSSQFALKTGKNINDINQSLNTVNGQLNRINNLLENSLVKISQQKKQLFRMSVGGFTVGIATAALFFFVAK